MTIDEALAYGRFSLPSSPTAALDARLLLQHVLGQSHTYLIAYNETGLSEVEVATYEALVERAAQGEPIPYLVGTAPFYGRDFAVNRAVLIPRWETELLVERALSHFSAEAKVRVVDVGTGSGCIGVTVALERPLWQVTAVDLSAAALAVATANGERLGGTAVNFVQGSLLGAIDGPIDLIVANLPYVTEAEWTRLDDGVKLYEPEMALIGGADGLILIKQLLTQAQTRLSAKGIILLEIGWQQGAATQLYAQRCFPQATVSVHQDYAGHDRIVEVRRG